MRGRQEEEEGERNTQRIHSERRKKEIHLRGRENGWRRGEDKPHTQIEGRGENRYITERERERERERKRKKEEEKREIPNTNT